MKTLKYILILILSVGLFNSCLFEETAEELELNGQGPNLASFESNKSMFSGIADGTEYQIEVKLKVVGPTSMDLTDDITVTVNALTYQDDTLSTAVEGVHYRIDNPTIVLKESDNHLGIVTVTMITEGIETPLDENPVLLLEVESASGSPNVVANGKKMELTLNYACYSEFQGTYNVETSSSSGAVVTWTETITKIGVEQYLTQRVGTWDPPLNPDYGFIFDNACNDITVPEQGLADIYSNEVWSHKSGNYNPETGVLTIYYTIWFAAGDVEYTAVYTPVD